MGGRVKGWWGVAVRVRAVMLHFLMRLKNKPYSTLITNFS